MSVCPFVRRSSVRLLFRRVLSTTTRTRDTLFECLYTVSNLKLSKIDQKKLSFCNKGTIDEKVFLKKVDKKITELDMDKLVIFSQTGLVCTVQNQEKSHVFSCLKVGSRHIDPLEKLNGGCTRAVRATLALRV